jgi:hypothetical protein
MTAEAKTFRYQMGLVIIGFILVMYMTWLNQPVKSHQERFGELMAQMARVNTRARQETEELEKLQTSAHNLQTSVSLLDSNSSSWSSITVTQKLVVPWTLYVLDDAESCGLHELVINDERISLSELRRLARWKKLDRAFENDSEK